MHFNPPPNWPQPPAGWTPPAGWQPDPTWGPAPFGWQLWAEEPQLRSSTSAGSSAPAVPPHEQRIFISYRRSDAQSQANALYEGLSHRISDAKVFMDIDSIPIGADFEQHIKDEISVCDQVLVVIGDNWLDCRPGSRLRRIDEPRDFVRLEIEVALAAPRVRIVPVLVEGVSMPSLAEIPSSIARLGRLNAIELSDNRWPSDLGRLAEQLRQSQSEQRQDARAGYEAQAAAPSISLADIDLGVVRKVIGWLPTSFNTKHVSRHPSMIAAHPGLVDLAPYDAVVGRVIRENIASLGLGNPEAAIDDRGALWTKRASTYAPPAPPPTATYAPPAPPPTATYAPPYRPPVVSPPQTVPAPISGFVAPPWEQPRPARSSSTGLVVLFIAIPILCFGLGAFAPALRAALWFEPRDPRRTRLFAAAGALLVASVVAFALIGSAPEDANGSSTGAASNVGVILILACMAIGVTIAAIYRTPPTSPAVPGRISRTS